jgi:hypothetical protein
MLSKILLISSLSLFLTGCPWHQTKPTPVPPPEIIFKTVPLDCGAPPQRPPIDLRPISWKIIGDRFTLDPKGYEDLSYNVSEIWSGVEHLRNEVKFYEQCILEQK